MTELLEILKSLSQRGGLYATKIGDDYESGTSFARGELRVRAHTFKEKSKIMVWYKRMPVYSADISQAQAIIEYDVPGDWVNEAIALYDSRTHFVQAENSMPVQQPL